MTSLPSLIEAQDESVREVKRLTLVHSTSFSRHDAAKIATGSLWCLSSGKRAFDILVSSAILLVGGIPMLLIALMIRLTSRGPAIFSQKRVGQSGRLFSIFKFRSMVVCADECGSGLTKSGDCRVTPIGKWLRMMKLDELPQFYNVLRGDMSIVGPRPKLPQFADDRDLAYRPGITGAASLAFRREEEILASVPADQVEVFYQQRIKPLKAIIDARYSVHATFQSDLRIILSTLCASFNNEHAAALQAHDIEPLGRSAAKPVTVLRY
ncbi:sugar transferase [Occallatibacter riparius]|uniref:Sugar transferase n=1 Tax=Occallatibacter riparius TaxID=1002689 RepID=A0A9J7BKQ2_9BACT|nr:sugar transferase [Occallatibacter riparius]UWZ81845.1 sugar transferase [Occallatibacter riparius]